VRPRDELPEEIRPQVTGVALFDKSAIQGMTRDEIDVLSRCDIYQNVPPVLMGEILGDVAKDHKKGRGDTAEMVKSLAHKIGGFHSTVSVDYRQICALELLGSETAPLDSFGILPAGMSLRRTEDGDTAALIDQREFNVMIDSWKRGRFTQDEVAWAERWRRTTYSFSREMLTRRLRSKHVLLPRPTDIPDCHVVVSGLLGSAPLQSIWLEYLIEELRMSDRAVEVVRHRWAREGAWLSEFAPYAERCMRVILTVTTAANHKLIRWSPTTIVDATYLYYLPLCEIFVSEDHVHKLLAPGLLVAPQKFISTQRLKAVIRPLTERARTAREAARSEGRPL
jgi:hypothetical protein